MLFQRAFLDDETYSLLHIARKSRNDLVHSGIAPTVTEAEAAFDALFRLISLVHTGVPDTLLEMISRYKAIDPFTKRALPTEPIPVDKLDGLWLGPLPPIPGEKEWGDKEYPKVFFS
jgi:hypothetical protein